MKVRSFKYLLTISVLTLSYNLSCYADVNSYISLPNEQRYGDALKTITKDYRTGIHNIWRINLALTNEHIFPVTINKSFDGFVKFNLNTPLETNIRVVLIEAPYTDHTIHHPMIDPTKVCNLNRCYWKYHVSVKSPVQQNYMLDVLSLDNPQEVFVDVEALIREL
ncbi:MAG: hypothetical protein ACPGUD_05155 [Parashewanella sp.]